MFIFGIFHSCISFFFFLVDTSNINYVTVMWYRFPLYLSYIQGCSMGKALGLNYPPVSRCPSISSDPTNPGVDFGTECCNNITLDESFSELWLARGSWVPHGFMESQNCSGWKSLFLDPAYLSQPMGFTPGYQPCFSCCQMSPVAQVFGNILGTPGWAQWLETAFPLWKQSFLPKEVQTIVQWTEF